MKKGVEGKTKISQIILYSVYFEYQYYEYNSSLAVMCYREAFLKEILTKYLKFRSGAITQKKRFCREKKFFQEIFYPGW